MAASLVEVGTNLNELVLISADKNIDEVVIIDPDECKFAELSSMSNGVEGRKGVALIMQEPDEVVEMPDSDPQLEKTLVTITSL